MAYQVLARRWRPRRFDEVVGQDHVTRTLRNAIKKRRLAHAFLFAGPRGVGKTTTARILAKCLNCETAKDGPVAEPCNTCTACEEIAAGRSLDVLEIDGASNRGIDEIRDLRENVRYAPSAGRAKVYIIDEVHMLTKEAFNALLKTLEEPPDGVYFVFATTEAHKVPATIRSRCQQYDFHRISDATIAETLAKLAEREKLSVDPAALLELARHAAGGLRDAESLLDPAAAVGEGTVTSEGLRRLLGEAADAAYLEIVERAAGGDAGGALRALAALLERGMDPGRIAVSLTQVLRDLLVVQAAPDDATALGVRADLVGELARVGGGISAAKLTALLTLASRTVAELRRSSRPRLSLEVALARMSRLADPGEIADLALRLEGLGGSGESSAVRRPAGGAPPTVPPTPRGRGSAPRAPRPGPSRGPDPEEPRASFADEDAEPPVATAVEPRRPAATGRVGEVWSELLERVRVRKVMLASFLEHGSPEALEDDALVAVFDNTYYEGMVGRRENIAVISEELAAILGGPRSLRVRRGVIPGKRVEEEPRKARGRDLLAENPGLSRIVHELGGQVVPDGGSFGGGEG
ncbi:MAG: DNA polymerase III subunit gamma/tau [Candidatus Eiseniibacteriota bacterium]